MARANERPNIRYDSSRKKTNRGATHTRNPSGTKLLKRCYEAKFGKNAAQLIHLHLRTATMLTWYRRLGAST